MIKQVIDSYHIEHYCDFCGRQVDSPTQMIQGDITGESPFGDLKEIPFECCDECRASFDGKDKIEVLNGILRKHVKYQFDKALNYYAPLNIAFYDKEKKE